MDNSVTEKSIYLEFAYVIEKLNAFIQQGMVKICDSKVRSIF